jgi:hypothetical protein
MLNKDKIVDCAVNAADVYTNTSPASAYKLLTTIICATGYAA